MAFRAHHLVRSQKLLYQASRRAITIVRESRNTYTREKVSITKPQPSTEDSNIGTTNAGNEAPDQSQGISDIHWALSPAYKVGKKIPKSSVEYLPEIPPWHPHVIALRLRHNEKKRDLYLPSLWLRDNCRCSKCVNQDTMQRAFDTFSIPRSMQPVEVVVEKEGLKVTWAYDGHVSLYNWDFLFRHQNPETLGLANLGPGTAQSFRAMNTFTYWGSEIAADPPAVHYDEIMADDTGVGKWTQKIRLYGFCYVDGCPISPERTKELLERISFIRRTHYGGFYDFTSDLTMKDTAYTTQALAAHTDTTYFTDPAGLQMFHLLSHTEGEGGASLLVDGFKAAKVLKAESKKAYETLSLKPVPWHASGNEGINIAPSKKMPVFGFDDTIDQYGSQLLQIRWNNDDRGVFEQDYMPHQSNSPHGRIDFQQWYWAAGLWNGILRRKDMEYWAQLKPGRPLIFDNWRVLHGRSAFTGKRRICGGYVNRDDYISRWRNTNFSREEVLAQVL